MKMRPIITVVLVPYPAQGHVTPMLHLARALQTHGFDPILAVPDFVRRRMPARSGDEQIAFASIPSGLGDGGGRDFVAIDWAMEKCMPAHLERVVEGLRSEGRVVCVVADLLASWAVEVAARCGVPAAGFWPAMLATYRVISAIPELIRNGFISDSGIPLCDHQHQANNHQEKLLLTQANLSTKDLPWLVGNSASQKSRFEFWLRTLARTKSLRWLLINSFPDEDCEPSVQPFNPSVQPFNHHTPQTFQIGPLLSSNNNKKNNNNNLYSPACDADNSCIEWLETQHHPPLSVIYVSFGTWVGPIGPDKVNELALGLEKTDRPFIWVLRDDAGWRAGLPKGFINRIADRGRVVGWAPQEAVLAHPAIGCYVTHCGWNSTVEAIRYGKRLVCYPISGDQFVNCNYIVKVWGIGLKLDGFGRNAIAESIDRIVEGEEGEEIQARVLELKERVMGDEGSSRAGANLQLFVEAIRGLTSK